MQWYLWSACNILVDGAAGIFTLRNYGRRSNCSLAAIYPANILVLEMNIGIPLTKGGRRALANQIIPFGYKNGKVMYASNLVLNASGNYVKSRKILMLQN